MTVECGIPLSKKSSVNDKIIAICYEYDMRKISEHVRAVVENHHFIREVLREGVGNLAQIARRIRPEVETRAHGRVGHASIHMALHRLEHGHKREVNFGARYLKHIADITVRGNLVLWYVAHRIEHDALLYKKLTRIAEKHPGEFCNVIYGLRETMLLAAEALEPTLTDTLDHLTVLERHGSVTAVTMRLPLESMSVPGVYYPILQAAAWAGVSIIEIISVRSELTLVCHDRDMERLLAVVRSFQK